MMRITALILLCLLPAAAMAGADTFRVYFPSGQALLSPAGQARLDSLLYEDRLPAGQPLQLYGYGDDVGDDAYNARLSAGRARAVKAYLLTSGLTEKIIASCRGKGKIVHAGHHLAGYAPDRRVDIVFGAPVKPEAVKKPLPAAIPVDISRLQVNETFTLDRIYFMPGISVMEPTAEPVLRQLVCLLEDHDAVRICLEGHINGGDNGLVFDPLDQYTDLPLSVARAKRVYDYLVANGIPAGRLSYKGWGARFPVVANARSMQDMQRNMRVEVRILSK